MHKWGLIALLGEADAAAGGTDRIRDTIRLQSVTLASTAFDGAWVRISSGTRDGEQSRVDRLDQDNGDLYVSPVFGGSMPDDSNYEIWAHGVDPDDADRARDKALTKICSQWAMIPLSEVPNADYELALAASNWNGENNATLAIATLSFPTEFARNSLTVTSTAGVDEYAESASMYVQPSEDFYLYVPVSARATTTAEVIVQDITNTAEISLSGTATATGRGFTGIEVTFTAPSGCFEITVRLNNQTGSGSISEWGPVNLHRRTQHRIDLPARVDSRNYVGPVFFLRNQMATGVTDWGLDTKEEVPGVRVEQVGDSVQVRLENGMINAPYFYSERFFYTALSTAGYFDIADRTTGDAGTTLCPLDYVVAGTVRLLAEQYVNRPGQDREFWAGLHQQALADLARFEREFGPQPQPRQERARTIVIPQARV